MFKRIPGNKEFRINFSGTIVNYDDAVVDIQCDEDGFIEIDLYGKIRKIKKSFLALLAHYEYGVVDNLDKVIKNISACLCTSPILRINCRYVLTHLKPIEFKEGFRYIPSYPKYAINNQGCVIDTENNVFVNKTSIDKNGYASIYIYNPDRNENRWTRIHRLMALAWLPNTDFLLRPYVNHIDGNKANYSLSNLEWCSLEENAKHAVFTGLNDTNVRMKSRDVLTGEIVHYHSASELHRKLGLTGSTVSAWQCKLPGYLWNKRYEIKKLEDTSPWFYENHDVEASKAIFTITVIDKETGVQKNFININSFRKEYKLYSKRNRIDEIVSAFKKSYPQLEVSYQRNSVSGPYRVTDTSTGIEEDISSMHEAAAAIGISRTELQYDLSRDFKFIYNGKYVVIALGKGCDFDISEFVHKPKAYNRVEIRNTDTGKVTIARSMREAAPLAGIDYKTVKRYIDSGKSFKNMVFRAVE